MALYMYSSIAVAKIIFHLFLKGTALKIKKKQTNTIIMNDLIVCSQCYKDCYHTSEIGHAGMKLCCLPEALDHSETDF